MFIRQRERERERERKNACLLWVLHTAWRRPGHKGRRSQDKVVCWGTNTGYLFARTVTHVSRLHGLYGSRICPLSAHPPFTSTVYRYYKYVSTWWLPCNPPPGFRRLFRRLNSCATLVPSGFSSFFLFFRSRKNRALLGGLLFEICSNAVCMLVNEINGSGWNIRCVVTRFEACSKNWIRTCVAICRAVVSSLTLIRAF